MVRTVANFDDLTAATGGLKGPSVVAFFGDFSEKSRRAWPVFEAFCKAHPELDVHLVDLDRVRDVHRRLGVTLAPTVLLMRDGAVHQQLVGVQTDADYQAALLPHTRPAPGPQAGATAHPSHRVLVYTGPGCSWCTRVKAYLRQRNVSFTEIDVSLEPAQAQALVRKTGQTGVPQLDIDGRYVVGFDKARIDALLGLAPQASAGTH
jgi:glutaredoxin-like YruB-family protein